jgi:signal transduction histidine kinase
LADAKIINIVKDQLKRATVLASNVRKLSELESQDIYLSQLEVIQIIEECKDFILDAFPHKKINISINPEHLEMFIQGNELFNDVIENLLFNSIHHNANDDIEVKISVSKVYKENTRYIKFEFIDNGIGIPDAIKEKVFLRGENETKAKTASGLGLKLVKKIIDLYDGRIWIEDRVKGEYSLGSKLVLLIPESI